MELTREDRTKQLMPIHQPLTTFHDNGFTAISRINSGEKRKTRGSNAWMLSEESTPNGCCINRDIWRLSY